jgi:hypothetical protein
MMHVRVMPLRSDGYMPSHEPDTLAQTRLQRQRAEQDTILGKATVDDCRRLENARVVRVPF